MRSKKLSKVNLVDGKITIEIPVSYETIDSSGKLGWTVGTADIKSPLNNERTREVILDALKKARIV